MGATMDTGLQNEKEQDHALEYPQKADLRTLFSQNPVPIILPETVDPDSMSGEEPTNQALGVLKGLNEALPSGNAEMLQSCFFPEQAYWKDHLALTWHLRTFTTPSGITAALLETKTLREIEGSFELNGEAHFIPATPVLQFIDCTFTFRTGSPAARCSGRLLLLPCPSHVDDKSLSWKIWVLSTKLESLDICIEDMTLLESPGRTLSFAETMETDVFIVGGGNGAISLAARLKTLAVESIMIDRNAHVGDNWALRYDCMRFHVTTSLCELPYMIYAKELQSPHLLTKDELSEQVRRYVKAFNLNVITSAEIIETIQMPDKRWSVKFNTPAGVYTVIARHLAQATGIGSQKPNMPIIKDAPLYSGISMHSKYYKNAKDLKNQGTNTVLVIGSANTAFDILEDCHNAGLKPTMVVRSPTYICPLEYVTSKLGLGSYDDGVEAADERFMTIPTVLDGQLARDLFRHFASLEPDRYTALAAAGFPVYDSLDPKAALVANLLENGGGHYIDTGATALIAEKKVSIKANVEPTSYTTTGLQFSDGSTLDADAVIWCTGYSDKNARDTFTEIFKTKIDVDATWGVDEEGEIRGMWKRHLRLENFWVAGGYTSLHRWHSKTLALQIKAALEGALPPAYREPRFTEAMK
ncbi:FAD/NAD(P)-binding domain-containing protein [Cadophora sp. DSE1049]|nr:FAD/NAD(P)-binding domain-containing protein [Cadophora sp. DSE1049]